MDWRISLDRWLTQTPEEYFGIDESYYEKIWDSISEEDISDEDYDNNDLLFQKWEDYLQRRGYSPAEAGKLIVKTFKKMSLN